MPKGERLIEFIIHAMPEDAQKFGEAIPDFPGVNVVGVREVFKFEPEINRQWKDELADLQEVVSTAASLFESGDANVIVGYEELIRRIGRSIYQNFYSIHPESVGPSILALMKSSVEVYTGCAERPMKRVGRSQSGLTYKRFNKALTPREIRLLIYGFGLTGEKYSEDQLAVMEDIRRPNNAISELLIRFRRLRQI